MTTISTESFCGSGFAKKQLAEAWRESLLQIHVEVAKKSPWHDLSAGIIADSLTDEEEAFCAKYALGFPGESALFDGLKENIEYELGIATQEDSLDFESDDFDVENEDGEPDLHAVSRAESDWQNWRGF